jgi:hypothetical protein
MGLGNQRPNRRTELIENYHCRIHCFPNTLPDFFQPCPGIGSDPAVRRARDFLLRTQNGNGSWPAFAGDDERGSWVTSLAAIALRDVPEAIPARLRGLRWLLDCSGRESHWPWKWKFRSVDRHVCFDPDKFGWPWQPDTVSWVVPTAFAVMALNQLPCACGGFERLPWRIERGVQMLLDRACPDGGWNAGNGIVYGTALSPHPDDTAIALLALVDRRREVIVQRSVAWLESVTPNLSSAWSLAWALLALAAHGHPISTLRGLLGVQSDSDEIQDCSTLALVCLGLDHQRALAALGVQQ